MDLIKITKSYIETELLDINGNLIGKKLKKLGLSDFKEELWSIYNKIEIPMCICGNKLTFLGFTKGFSKHCSCKCAQNDKKVREKIEKTFLNKYGVTVPAKNTKVLKKMQETCIKKYGVNTPLKNKEIIKKIKKSKKENPENKTFYPNQIGYWLKQGYSEEESKQKVKERQTTFCLDKCIEKYGKEKGIERWEQRQEKWQNTLNSKTQDEIDDINRRKSTGIGRIPLHLRNMNGILYYIRFYNKEIEFWKIGITTKTIEERFETKLLHEEKYNLKYDIIFTIKDTIQNCYNMEQKILKTFNPNRIKVNHNGFISTECFNKDILILF